VPATSPDWRPRPAIGRVRFFLDHDVPVSVATMLRDQGHQCWTASEAGLATEGQDDNLTVYADQKAAVLVTMDKEFSQRRLKHSIGRHVWLRCPEPEAAALLRSKLEEVLPFLERVDVTITVSHGGVYPKSAWK
jgi:predicted nuclease of predicted toxin-antitoxin system